MCEDEHFGETWGDGEEGEGTSERGDGITRVDGTERTKSLDKMWCMKR